MDNHCISKIREIFRVITAFECGLQEQIGLNINEAMLLCLLSESEKPMLAGEIAEEMSLTRSNTSKESPHWSRLLLFVAVLVQRMDVAKGFTLQNMV